MEFTGERFVPELQIDSEISILHRQRYMATLDLLKGKRVLDAACGEGYGSAMISAVAKEVVGIDISEEAIENATNKYQRENLRFMMSSVTDIALDDGSVDVVISFETIEHITEQDQILFLKEIKRVLSSNGILIISSPDRKNYSDIPHFYNKYHIHELYFEEFDALLRKNFREVEHFYQGMFCNSYIYRNGEGPQAVFSEIKLDLPIEVSRSEYNIAICTDSTEGVMDISSVIYDSTNRYYKMKDEEILLKERLGDPGKIIEQKENYICEQRDIIIDLQEKERQQGEIIEQKENYICEQRTKIMLLEETQKEQKNIIQQKNRDVNDLEEKLKKVYSIPLLGMIIRKFFCDK